jgi:FtsP/CotA-like multicopper oxidase with cupredoxin domain
MKRNLLTSLVTGAALLAGSLFIPASVAANLQSVSVSTQSGALTTGTAGSVDYTVTVNRSSGSPNTTTMSISGLPAGATGSFGAQSAWSPSTGTGSRTVPLTVSITAALAAGSYNFTVQASGQGPDPTGTGTLVVNAAPVAQTITFAPLADKTYGDADFDVSATASSGLAVSFAATGDCTVAGTLVHLSGAGSCTITASQAGDASYLPAPDVSQTFAIDPGDQTITFDPLATKYVGDSDFDVSATASSGLAVSFAAAGDCAVAGTLVHLTGAVGSCTITASQVGDANYNAASDVARTFAIETFTGDELYAVTGSAALPGQTVTVWGYSGTGAAVDRPGGPTLIVNEGDTVLIRLHNALGESTGLLFQGQSMVPDTTGTAAGTTKVYSFTASHAGTYLYEAGLLPNAEHQVAMGLYGALVVRPATAGQAYESAATAYDDEAVVVLSEIDPALNTSTTPAAFDMRGYAPKYFLINGKTYPDTDPIPTAAGNKVLLRYVNAGVAHHSMGALGLSQTVIADDGSLLTYSHRMVAETIGPGQTIDAIATVPAGATGGTRFALYDANQWFANSSAPAFGGMLAFLTVSGTPPTGDTTGPISSSLSLTATSIGATVSDAGRGDANVTAAEFFIDSTGASGTGTAMTGSFGSVTVNVSGAIAPALAGTHTVYVHGMDAVGNWGPFQSATISVDTVGPTTSGLTLSPSATNGTVAVALSATANDTASGGSNIAAAEYSIDGGTAVAMTVSPSGAQVANLTATIPAATVAALSAGSHDVSVRSQDTLGNWGTAATVNLVVDKIGPSTSNVNAAPNPNNGTVGYNSSTPAVYVVAQLSDSLSNISTAEGFIDTVGTNGTGFAFIANDGVFNSPSENGYAYIPLTTVAQLSNGNHTIYVHGKDAAGNWGATSSTILVIDKTAPTISSVTLTPSTLALGAASTQLTVSATDTGTGVSLAQYWIDGSATPPANPTTFGLPSATIDTSALAAGTHTVYVRVQDAATNWSAVSSATLFVVLAVNDARTITANGSTTQTSDANAAAGVLTNDEPVGVAGRTAALTTAVVRTSGNGAGTLALSCPASLGTAAAPSVSGQTICTNGAYRVTLNGVGNNNNQRAASKRGTFQFTYTETLNGVTSTATVTITVN